MLDKSSEDIKSNFGYAMRNLTRARVVSGLEDTTCSIVTKVTKTCEK